MREMRLDELVDIHGKIRVNGHEIGLTRGVQVNGELKNENYILKPEDTVEVLDIQNIDDLASHLDLSLDHIGFKINGEMAEASREVRRNDKIQWVKLPKDDPKVLTVDDVVEEIDVIRESAHAEELIQEEEKNQDEDHAEEALTKTYHLVINGSPIQIETKKSP